MIGLQYYRLSFGVNVMDIIIERGKVCKLSELPKYSIALDGFCQGPEIQSDKHRYSFDHHAKCLRLVTLSTCQQAINAVRLGLDPSNYSVYANDVDIDVCAAIWCLKNPDRCKEPLVLKLIDAIGMGDMFAGGISSNGMQKVVEWVCYPETRSRTNGDYEKLSNDGMQSILEAILHRMDSYVNGEAAGDIQEQKIDVEYKILRNENGWALLESQDPHSLGEIWKSFDKIVLLRPLEDESIAVTLAKRSDFIEGFPLEKFYKAFNKIEPGWGGGSSIGGCVRNEDGSRSSLSIEEIVEVIDEVLGFGEEPEEKPKKKTTKKSVKKKKAKKDA